MANGEVGIKIKVSARDAVNNLNKLKTISTKLQTSFKKVETAAARLQNRAGASFQKFGNRVRKVRRKVQVDLEKMKRSFKGMNNVGALIGGAGLGLFAKASIQTAASAQALQLRLKLLTGDLQSYEQAQKIASKAAKTFGMSTLESLRGVTNIIGRLKPLGQSLEDIEDIFFGFNTAAKLAGVSTVEASNAFRQLAQALGSGRLAGDEFRSISEQVPTILKPIADELDVTVGALKELGAQGLLTSDVVLRSLKKIRGEGAGLIGQIIKESDIQVFKNLSNAFEDLKNTVGKQLMPVVKPLIKDITALIQAFNNASPVVKRTVVLVGALTTGILLLAPAIAGVTAAASAIGAFFASGGGVALLGFLSIKVLPIIALLGSLGLALSTLGGHFQKIQEKQAKFQELLDTGSLKALKEAKATELNTIAQLGNAGARTGAAIAIREQIQAAEERIKQIDTEITKLELLNKTFKIGGIDYKMDSKGLIPVDSVETDDGNKKKTPLLDELEKERKFLDNALKMGTAKAKLEERIADLMREQNGLTEEQARKKVELLDKDQKRLALQEQIREILATGMTNAVMGLIEGTKTLGQALADIAKSLAKMFLNAAFQNIFSGLKFGQGEQGLYNRAGGFKAFQYGGVVNSPTLGMIGEGGEPEYVIPASKMDGAISRYSAGARGGAVIPGGSHESGTVAGGTGNTVVEYTGPTLNFNGDEYVPKSAVPEIIGAAAKQGAIAGKAQVIGSFKNSRSQRASLGL